MATVKSQNTFPAFIKKKEKKRENTFPAVYNNVHEVQIGAI